MGVTAKIKGIDKVLKNFKQFGEEGLKEFGDITNINAKGIAAMAKTNAPKNLGKLAQSIHEEKITNLNYRIKVGSDYGVYLEFGTGRKVSVPPELQKEAARFKGRGMGSFEEGLKSIKDWCRSKGIDVKAAYPIFISILEKGIEPQPYLYPAFVKGRIRYIKDLKGSLKHLTKKFNSK
jgi:HK97 gp10 family phage protein